MAITKNSGAKAPAAAAPKTETKTAGQKAAETKAANKPAASAKPAAKPAAAKAEKPPKAEKPKEVEKVAVEKLSRKELAAALREKVMAAGKAIPESIAGIVVVAYEEVIAEALAAGKEVNLPGFGKFVVRFKEASVGRNPSNGEQIDIPARNVPAFKVGAKLKAAVNGGEADPESDAADADATE